MKAAQNGIICLPAKTSVSGGKQQPKVPPFGLIDCELGQVRLRIEKELDKYCNRGGIGGLIGHLKNSQGKMIRPALMLLAGKAIKTVTDEHIKVAAVIEIIHNATLLHDDVIDLGQKRRGRPTVNSLWGNETAVLMGDLLLSTVLRFCADLKPQVVGIIADTTSRICSGELQQLLQRQNWQMSEDEYLGIITEKSASFFSCCCLLGGLLAGANQSQLKHLQCFGLNCGIAFQITDDMLDITGDETRTGKTMGSDIDGNKPTLPAIHLLRTVDYGQRTSVINLLASACGSRKDGTQGKDALVAMLNSNGSVEYAYSRASWYVAKATKALAQLKQSNAKTALIDTAKFLAERKT